MSRFTPLNTVSALIIAGFIAAAGGPAAQAATPVAPEAVVQVSTEEPVQPINPVIHNSNASVELRSYTYELGMSLLNNGPDFMPTNLQLDANAEALASALMGGYDRSVGDPIVKINGVMVAPVNDGEQVKVVVVNGGTVRSSLSEPLTGKSVVIEPKSAILLDGHVLKGAIKTAFWAQGGPDVFGNPTGPEVSVGTGVKQTFENSTFYWSSATGVDVTKGAIKAKHDAKGGATGVLKFPKNSEQKLATGGYWQEFEGGRIYWKSGVGAFVVDLGAIGKKYVAMGGTTSALGYPTSDKKQLSSTEFIQNFENGYIYWNNGVFTISTATPVYYG